MIALASPVHAEGVVRLVPRTPAECAAMAAALELAAAAASGDVTARERLDVLGWLLTDRVTAGAPTREGGDAEQPGVTTPAVTTIEGRAA